MSVINELIRTEDNGTISFGNYMLAEKSKKEDVANTNSEANNMAISTK